MNDSAKRGYLQLMDIVKGWQSVNHPMYEHGCQLIIWIEKQMTYTTPEQRQEVKATNWEALLSGFPTEAIQEEIKRRISSDMIISSKLSVCHMCGIAPTIRKEEKGYEIYCDQCRDTTFFFDTLKEAEFEWEQNIRNKLAEE